MVIYYSERSSGVRGFVEIVEAKIRAVLIDIRRRDGHKGPLRRVDPGTYLIW